MSDFLDLNSGKTFPSRKATPSVFATSKIAPITLSLNASFKPVFIPDPGKQRRIRKRFSDICLCLSIRANVVVSNGVGRIN